MYTHSKRVFVYFSSKTHVMGTEKNDLFEHPKQMTEPRHEISKNVVCASSKASD